MTFKRWITCIGLCVFLSFVGCGNFGLWTDLEEVSCPPEGTKLTYENFGKQFLADWCDSCHSVDSKSRRGAPLAYIFDTYEATHALRKRIFLRSAANNTTMPPGPDDPPKEQRDKLAEWIACGAPK